MHNLSNHMAQLLSSATYTSQQKETRTLYNCTI